MKILSWNIACLPNYCNIFSNPIDRIPRILSIIEKHDADIICLQEVFDKKIRKIIIDGENLNGVVKDFKQILESYPGVYNISDNSDKGSSEIFIKLSSQAERYGINIKTVSESIRDAFQDAEVASIREGRDEVDIIIGANNPHQDEISNMVKAVENINLYINNLGFLLTKSQMSAIEEITRDIPNVSEESLRNLDESGIVYIGAEVKASDILVGKVTPKGDTPSNPEEKLLRSIFGEKATDVRDSSLKMPPGSNGIVVDVRVFNRHGIEKDERSNAIERSEIESVQEDKLVEEEILERNINIRIQEVIFGKKLKSDFKNFKSGSKITQDNINNINLNDYWKLSFENEQTNKDLQIIKEQYNKVKEDIKFRFEDKVQKIQQGDDLLPNVLKMVKVFVAVKRSLRPGDKMAGRHGNKGVISKIVPIEDMPYMENGKPVDVVLNPLGVPSRMNVGQILETHLGWACSELGEKISQIIKISEDKKKRDSLIKDILKKVYGNDIYENKISSLSKKEFDELSTNLSSGVPIATPVFDGASVDDVTELLKLADLPSSGQTKLWDGRSGEQFDREVTVGIIYILKLHHLVEDKIHARSTGPYSLVTQQPLGGRAQLGGQRFGEMEVWALEAYGASYTLQEILTVKSDDVAGRTKVYETIVKGDDKFESGVPESFNVLTKEIKALALNIELN